MKRLPGGVAMAVLAAVLGAGQPAVANEAYYVKPLQDLKFTDGKLPRNLQPDGVWHRGRPLLPYAALEGGGEAYIVVASPDVDRDADKERDRSRLNGSRLAVRVPERREVRGKLFLPQADGEGLVSLAFVIPAEEGTADLAKAFQRVKRAHYERLLQVDIAGAAWFRHQVRSATEALGEKADQPRNRRRQFFGITQATSLENTYALASGGRAVSENLQLDRELPQSALGEATVSLNTIQGITIREFDWTELTKDINPQLDPLAILVPDDQHALFFSSFAALVKLADAAPEQGTPVLQAAEARAEDARSRERYLRQLCLPLGQTERFFGPQLVRSVAITGGDPYFRTGTDVAVLLESKNARVLREMIDAHVTFSRKEHPSAEAVEGEIDGVAYTGARSPGRKICCYVASLDDVVIVANSLKQLERIVAVHHGRAPALAALPEYAFFRHRYPRTDAEETAFLVITDKTIRRWCGPKWRIAASRRTRAAAVMAEVQAQHLERIVAQDVDQEEVKAAFWVPRADRYTLAAGGVRSSVYGDLTFQTPISELDVAYVTREEAELYNRWRDGYQRNWRNFFDPIAVRFTVADDKLAVDLTVMPLIANSDYRRFTSVSQGARLQPQDGDPHAEALAHWALALNPESETMQSLGTLATGFIRVNPLSWLGGSAAVYADRDPFWQDLAAAKDQEEFFKQHAHRTPIALYVSTRNGLKLTAFLTGVRGFIEQTAPGMTVWEAKTHNEEPYVKVSPSERARAEAGDRFDEFAIYYAASGQGLTVTPSESLLQRALDRHKAQRAAGEQAAPPQGATPWIGDNLCLQVDGATLGLLQAAWGEDFRQAMQARAWGNLPILNEWKRLFPKHDPLELHERLWGVRPVCPGGGEYVWNETWRTYESTAYGHPGQPQADPGWPAALRDVAHANFGVTFEEDGLRGRVELTKQDRDKQE